MMFTTELSHRVFLTVLLLLLGLIGRRPEAQAKTTTREESKNVGDNDKTNDEEQGLFKSILYSKPSSFYDQKSDQNHDPDLRSFSSKLSTFSGNNRRSPSTVMIKANLPFTTTTAVDSQNYNSKTKDLTRRNGLVVTDPFINNGNFFDCFFGKHKCVEEDKGDEWRNYYSVLNGLDKPGFNDRRLNQLPFGSPTEFQTGISASIPFIVDGGSGHNKGKDEENRRRGDDKEFSAFQHRPPSTSSSYWPGVPGPVRVSRTTTSSPSWVKLQPMPSHMYDPFPSNSNRSRIGGATNMMNTESRFASRLGGAAGEEMSPESFASRYGWSQDAPQNLRVPSWLEELNYKHGYRGQGPGQGGPGQDGGGGNYNDRPSESSYGDDGKNWVKLDPIPVSGVTISKWVPKGTSPSELPSTNWPVRDKPNAWWDRVDVGPSRPESSWSDGPIRSPLLASSASSSFGSHRYPSNHIHNNNKKYQGGGGQSQSHSQNSHSHTLSDAWKDIIYPDTPTSATASWEATKGGGGSSSSSSFPSSWLSNGNGGGNPSNKYGGRPAVASWTAPGSFSSSSNNINTKVQAGRFGSHRPPPPSSFGGRPSYYPDPQADLNDPRWVLVSTTGETSQKNPYRGNRPEVNSERYDFPYDYHQSHRHSKDMNLTKLLLSAVTEDPSIMTQEELFQRTNETLNSLAPIMHHRRGLVKTSTEQSEPFSTFIPILEDEIMADEGSLEDSPRVAKKLNLAQESGPGAGNQQKQQQQQQPTGKKSIFHGIKPVLAAVGAGMIPATLAAVVPLALGRRRRKRHADGKPEIFAIHRENRAVPRLVFTNPHQVSPMLLSSTAPDLYKFLRKPAMKKRW